MPLTRLPLTTGVSGTLAAGNGGTGVTSADEIGNLVLLNSASSTTDVTEIDFSSYVSTTYDEYLLHLSASPATDDVGLRLQMRSSGSFITSSEYGNAAQRLDSTSRQTHTTNGGARFELFSNGTQGNASGETAEYILQFTNMNSSNFATTCFWQVSGDGTAGVHVNFIGSGSLNTNTTVCDGFKIFYSSGDISAYEYRFYGVKK